MRSHFLETAIESVLSQDGVEAIPLVVLNGVDRCPDVERRLRNDARLQLCSLDIADLPAALAAGRAAVRTPWFANLDDDDVLLPGGLACRLDCLEREESLDVVATNGLIRDGDDDSAHLSTDEVDAINADPISAFLTKNWLLPGSWLCRTSAVGVDCFHGMPRYLECTFLALRFALGYKMTFLPETTVLYRLGSPAAESRSREYGVGQGRALKRLLSLPLPAYARRALKRRIAVAYHSASERDLRDGRLLDAWRLHLASLIHPGGLKYVPYTRRLMRGTHRTP